MPDGSDACLEGRFEGSVSEQIKSLAKTVEEMRTDLKPMLEDYQRRKAREQLIRDAGAFIGGAVSIVGAIIGGAIALFKFGQSSGWFGK